MSITVYSRSLDTTGAHISLCASRGSKEPAWSTRCEDHEVEVGHSSLAEAAQVFPSPEVWCSCCKEELTAIATHHESLL